jgi:hypothetical protein
MTAVSFTQSSCERNMRVWKADIRWLFAGSSVVDGGGDSDDDDNSKESTWGNLENI